jgi:hypothetical protein
MNFLVSKLNNSASIIALVAAYDSQPKEMRFGSSEGYHQTLSKNSNHFRRALSIASAVLIIESDMFKLIEHHDCYSYAFSSHD